MERKELIELTNEDGKKFINSYLKNVFIIGTEEDYTNSDFFFVLIRYEQGSVSCLSFPKERTYCLFGARFDSKDEEFVSETYKKYNLKVGDHFALKELVEKDNVTMFDIATIGAPEGDYIWFNINGTVYSCSAKNFFRQFEKVKLTVEVIRH